MRLTLFVLWALAGWCATLLLIGLRYPPPPVGPGDPPPRPNWLLPRIIGIVGGIAGGWIFMAVFGPQPDPWVATSPPADTWSGVVRSAATAVGAFIGASLLNDLYGLVMGMRKPTRG